jgi:rhodanese-related sulfurtransferase
MAKAIHREEVQQLLRQGGQLVEVLPQRQFREIHIAGAINIPLRSLNQKTVANLRRDKPVITYCYDYQ